MLNLYTLTEPMVKVWLEIEGVGVQKKVLKKTPQLQLLEKNINSTWTAALDTTEAGRECAREQ